MKNRIIGKCIVLGVVVLFVGASVVPSTGMVRKSTIGRSILYVGGSGPGNYTTIQAAINDANPGDTVFVYNGTYYESVNVNKALDLIGEDRNTTIIDGSGSGYVVSMSNNIIYMAGFTVKNCGSGDHDSLILVRNYNTIDNCILRDASGPAHSITNYGASDVHDVLVSNCSFIDTANMDMAWSCDFITIIDCSFNNSGLIRTEFGSTHIYLINCFIDANSGGTDFKNSQYCIVSNCTFYGNGIGGGIELNNGDNCLIENNVVINRIYGISFAAQAGGCNSNIIRNNTIELCEYGFGEALGWPSSNHNNVFYHNNFINNNISAYDGSTNTWYNTTLQEGNYYDDYMGEDNDGDGIGDTPYNISGDSNQDLYPLMYPWYPTHPDTVYVDDDYNISTPGFGYDRFNRVQYGINEVQENGIVTVFNGIYYENVVVDKSINLEAYPPPPCGKDKYNVIIDGGGNGDVVYVSADQVNIIEFTIQNSGNSWGDACIDVVSNGNTISGNIIMNNDAGLFGIYLHEISNDNSILGNEIFGCTEDGIYLRDSSNNNTISENTILNNHDGIQLYEVSNNNIFKNTILNNSDDGIGLGGSSNNNIFMNTFDNNGDVGVAIGSLSNNNIIYHNHFINNTQNAEDSGTNNTWDNGYPSGGNYWDDYTGDDLYSGPNQDIPGRDGIGDTPYNISGGDSQDRYPLMEPYGWINSPPNIPNRPSGESIILPGNAYTYTTSTIDPDDDSIWYKWDWGDGTFSDWLGPYDSEEEASESHIWSQGKYDVRVKAKDSRNPETDWSAPLTINAIFPNLKTVLLFGFITNLSISTDYNSFNVVKVLWIGFNPIIPEILSSNEVIVISDKFFGILRESFIIGFFNAMVLT